MKNNNYPPSSVHILERTTITPIPADDQVREIVPVASVIIVNYNGGKDLIPCLDSVLTDNLINFEIILVDNASQDESAIHAASLFPQIRLIHNLNNSGFGAANNLGARMAHGKYLVFLNPDTIATPGWLKALITALETNPQAGLATSKLLLLKNPDRVNACGNNVHITGLTMCRGMGKPANDFTRQEYVNAVSGAAFSIRRDLYEALGGFDPAFFLYLEDTDLSWRVHLAGYQCLFVPESVVYHDYTLTFGLLKTYYQERNRYLMLIKNLHWTTLLALMPVLLLAELVTWGFVLSRDRRNWTNKLRAYAWVIRHWKEIMQARKQGQQMRRMPDAAILLATNHRLIYEQTGQGFPVRLAHFFFDPIFQNYFDLICWLFQLEQFSNENWPGLLAQETSD